MNAPTPSEPTPRACKACGKLTTAPAFRASVVAGKGPKPLCPSCARGFDLRRTRTRRAVQFLILATLAAALAFALGVVACRLAFGPTSGETAAETKGIVAVWVGLFYLLAIRRRFGLGAFR